MSCLRVNVANQSILGRDGDYLFEFKKGTAGDPSSNVVRPNAGPRVAPRELPFAETYVFLPLATKDKCPIYSQKGAQHSRGKMLRRGAIALFVGFVVSGVFVGSAAAETPVGGPITSDTTWTAAGSPYVMNNSVTVNDGVTLTVEPGVRVEGGTDMSLFVVGKLSAVVPQRTQSSSPQVFRKDAVGKASPSTMVMRPMKV